MASLTSLTFTLLMIALGMPSMAQAASGPANLWIDTNGGTCTRQATPVAYADAQACSGIVAALSAAAAGDTVRIRPGSYGSATITQAKKSPAVSFIGDGTATTSVGEIRTKTGSGGLVFQDLTMSGYYNQQHTDDVTYRNAVINGNFYIRGSSNILWDHVEARIPSGTTTSSNFISSNYASSGALGSQNITIRDSYIHHYRRAAGSSDHVDCIAADDVDGLLIERTRFEDCEAFSIIFGKDNGTGRGARNVTLQNNIFNMASNGSSGYYNVCFTKMEGPAVLRFNSFDGKGVAECELLSTRGSVRMDSNVGLSNSSGNCSNSLFTWTRNVFPASPCAGGVTANPNYVNSAGGDFNLRAGSAAIDAGSSSYPPLDFSGSARFAGTAADAGALESGAGSAPAGPDTSLTSAPSGATTSTSATMAFTANPATSTFQCRIDGGAWTTCASPVVYNGLAVGAHSFDVRAIDLSGAIDATPATASWTVTAPVDTTPPNTTITSAPSGSITATSASLVFSATESATFECRMDGGSWTACTSPKAYSGLALGAHTFDVRATDLAGNVDLTPASAAWNVVAAADTTPPDTSIVSGPSGSTTSTSASLAFSATESATFECRMDGGSWTACTSPKAYSGLALGAHTFDVRATDAAGNTDLSPASRAWAVTAPADTTAPDTSITSGPSGSGTDTSAALSFTATEAGSTFECRLDGGIWASCASPKSYSAIAAGSHTFDVRATDAAGNTDVSPASRSWTVVAPADTTAPDTTITSGPPASTTATTASVSFTATEAGSTFQCRLDSGAWVACASPEGDSGLSVGAHKIDVRATDGAGNVDATPASWSWTVVAPAPSPPAPDTTAPDTHLTSGPTTVTTQRSATFEFTSTEATGAFSCSLDSSRWSACTAPKSYSSLSRGKHTIRVRATDAAGNTDATPVTYSWSIVRRSWGTTYSFEPLSGRSSTPVKADSLEGACALVSNSRARLGVRLRGLNIRRSQRAIRISGKVPELARDGVKARVRVSVRSHGRWHLLVSRRVHVRFDGSFRVKAPRRGGKLKVTAIARCG